MTRDRDSLLRAIAEEKAHVGRSRADERTPFEPFEPMWRALCGAKLDHFLANRASAEKYLRNSEWKLRLAAISILREVWGPDDELAAVCEKMAFEDAHEQVRGVALYTLASCFSGTNDTRVGMLLARVVYDSKAPEGVRDAAYRGLFRIRDVDIRAAPMPGKDRIPDDIDWVFVDSFLTRADPERTDD